MKLSTVFAGLTVVASAVAEEYIISFRNLDTPDYYYEKIKKMITSQYNGKIISEFTIIKGFTADIPGINVLSLETALNTVGSYPINVEKDLGVTILG